ncbi:MAG: CPBP family intramembrane glutamic endopeptidase [Chloroflexota bacterium]
MLDRKALTWFLIITLLISWPLFLAPLLFADIEPLTAQLITAGLWALAMWGPGLAAIVATLAIQKKPFRSLNLKRLGPKRYYLWAWFLPPVLSVAGGLFALMFGVAKLDTEFTVIREAMAQAAGGEVVPAGLVVAAQIAFAILLAPLINVLFALGEELGWRGFLLPHLMPLGQWKAILISGVIWGLWHAPAIVQGHNYPGYPVAGIFMMIVFCVLLAVIFSWLYLNTRSPWVAALAHGAVNASAGLPVLFFLPGFNMAFGGTLAAPTAWIGMALFIGWLVLTKRLPVRVEKEAEESASWTGGY